MENSVDVFKNVFKELKRRIPKPDYSEVIDFDYLTDNFENVSGTLLEKSNPCHICDGLGLKPHHTWSVFSVRKISGLLLISNPFTAVGQRHWIRRCLRKYPSYPNVTNLGVSSESTNLWQSYVDNDPNGYNELMKLRWTTLGYHHDWNTKRYLEHNRSPFPTCLSDLTLHTASVLGFNVTPEAAIINYYHLDSTLAGHIDHSEADQTTPILSFSFGRKAIFLIGGKKKSVRPVSMFVKSGDVILMSGESRLSYHAVPKIFPNMNQEENSWGDVTLCEEDWNLFEKYLNESRINMNVRQVGKISL